MSILSDLEAALEAKQEAWAAFTAYTHGADQRTLLDEYDIACSRYKAILTDDTVAALVAVAEAADTFCACERGGEPISRLSMEIALATLVKEADHE